MVFTWRNKQSNRGLFSQLDIFDPDVDIGDAANGEQRNVGVNDGSVDKELTVNNNDANSTTDENTTNVQTLEGCLTDKFDNETGDIVHTVEDRVQITILAAIDIFPTWGFN